MNTMHNPLLKLAISTFVDAFQGSGVPLGGDSLTSFQNVSLLELRIATVLTNSEPFVKARFIATNCGESRIEIVTPCEKRAEHDHEPPEDNVKTLLSGESLAYSIFRSWDAPGKHELTMAFQARRPGKPFARLLYPAVAVHVRPAEGSKLMHWLRCAQRLEFHRAD